VVIGGYGGWAYSEIELWNTHSTACTYVERRHIERDAMKYNI